MAGLSGAKCSVWAGLRRAARGPFPCGGCVVASRSESSSSPARPRLRRQGSLVVSLSVPDMLIARRRAEATSYSVETRSAEARGTPVAAAAGRTHRLSAASEVMEDNLPCTSSRARSNHCHGKQIFKTSKLGFQLLDLPEDMLCKILSELPLKEVIRTCVLSSKW
ncbi:hypothetical protein PAHAL_4G289200 [Panicum hallii]|uniref:F-box domain-containing protein n=1 Tax=Panicum hallii TaxID=206008 RepID=A0A2T8JEA3_9POAL|nr:hypothetical protein PAHAL_4G289200 [Panicum hallii]